MRSRKCLQGRTDLKLNLVFLKERLEALIGDERYEEAVQMASQIKDLEALLYDEFVESEL